MTIEIQRTIIFTTIGVLIIGAIIAQLIYAIISYIENEKRIDAQNKLEEKREQEERELKQEAEAIYGPETPEPEKPDTNSLVEVSNIKNFRYTQKQYDNIVSKNAILRQKKKEYVENHIVLNEFRKIYKQTNIISKINLAYLLAPYYEYIDENNCNLRPQINGDGGRILHYNAKQKMPNIFSYKYISFINIDKLFKSSNIKEFINIKLNYYNLLAIEIIRPELEKMGYSVYITTLDDLVYRSTGSYQNIEDYMIICWN